MGKARLVFISKAYINYLIKHCHSYGCKEDPSAMRRPYIQLPGKFNGHTYCIPLSSPKQSDYITNEAGTRVAKSDMLTHVRLTNLQKDTGITEVIGCVVISKMIPVPKSEIVLCGVDTENTSSSHRCLLSMELASLESKFQRICEKAAIVYSMMTETSSRHESLKSKMKCDILEFRKAEAACSNFSESLAKGISKEEILASVSHLPDMIFENKLGAGNSASVMGAIKTSVGRHGRRNRKQGAARGVEAPTPQPQESACSNPVVQEHSTSAGVEESLEGLSLTDGTVGGARPKCPRGYDEGSVRRIVLESRGGRGRSSSQSSGQPTQQVMGRGRGRGRTIAR